MFKPICDKLTIADDKLKKAPSFKWADKDNISPVIARLFLCVLPIDLAIIMDVAPPITKGATGPPITNGVAIAPIPAA